MKLMSLAEASQLLGVNELAKYIALSGSQDLLSKSYCLPKAAVDQTVLARSIARLVTRASSCYLQITYWHDDVDSNQDLFYGYRRGMGDERSLAEASVYQFLIGEDCYIASVLSLVLYFGWDARIFDSDLTYQIRVNNDGFFDLESTDAFGQEIVQQLSLLGLCEMTLPQQNAVPY